MRQTMTLTKNEWYRECKCFLVADIGGRYVLDKYFREVLNDDDVSDLDYHVVCENDVGILFWVQERIISDSDYYVMISWEGPYIGEDAMVDLEFYGYDDEKTVQFTVPGTQDKPEDFR